LQKYYYELPSVTFINKIGELYVRAIIIVQLLTLTFKLHNLTLIAL
jgi:hypothetical protein